MLQVRKNLSQANDEGQIYSPYDRSDGQNRLISLELRRFVRDPSLSTTRHIHHQQIQQRWYFHNLNPRGAHARQFLVYFRIGH